MVLGEIIATILWIFIAMMWVRFIVDWVQVFARSWSPSGPILVVLEVVYSGTDPPIKAVRRVLPALRLGSIAIDFGFLVVIIAAYVLLRVNAALLLG